MAITRKEKKEKKPKFSLKKIRDLLRKKKSTSKDSVNEEISFNLLTNLPFEIFIEIAAFLENKAILALRQSSKNTLIYIDGLMSRPSFVKHRPALKMFWESLEDGSIHQNIQTKKNIAKSPYFAKIKNCIENYILYMEGEGKDYASLVHVIGHEYLVYRLSLLDDKRLEDRSMLIEKERFKISKQKANGAELPSTAHSTILLVPITSQQEIDAFYEQLKKARITKHLPIFIVLPSSNKELYSTIKSSGNCIMVQPGDNFELIVKKVQIIKNTLIEICKAQQDELQERQGRKAR